MYVIVYWRIRIIFILKYGGKYKDFQNCYFIYNYVNFVFYCHTEAMVHFRKQVNVFGCFIRKIREFLNVWKVFIKFSMFIPSLSKNSAFDIIYIVMPKQSWFGETLVERLLRYRLELGQRFRFYIIYCCKLVVIWVSTAFGKKQRDTRDNVWRKRWLWHDSCVPSRTLG